MNGHSVNESPFIKNEPSFISCFQNFGDCATMQINRTYTREIIKMKESEELKDKICDIIANGATVDAACAQLKIAKDTLYRWVRADDKFRAAFDRAKDERTEAQLEEATQLLDNVSVLERDGFDKDRINAARLKVDTIKWFASKRLSKKYGDKTIHSNDPDNPMPSMQIYCPTEEKPEEK